MAHSDIPDIIYTKVDEAPELASASLLPIIRAFAGKAPKEFGDLLHATTVGLFEKAGRIIGG